MGDQVGQGGLDLWLVDQIVISDFNHIFEKENSFSKVEKKRKVRSFLLTRFLSKIFFLKCKMQGS